MFLEERGMHDTIYQIFQHFDARTLRELESLSRAWKQMFVVGKVWKMRLMEKVSDNKFFVAILSTLCTNLVFL